LAVYIKQNAMHVLLIPRARAALQQKSMQLWSTTQPAWWKFMHVQFLVVVKSFRIWKQYPNWPDPSRAMESMASHYVSVAIAIAIFFACFSL
jgi:hypothetical protein